MDNKQIEIFKSDDSSTEIEVRVDNVTGSAIQIIGQNIPSISLIEQK